MSDEPLETLAGKIEFLRDLLKEHRQVFEQNIAANDGAFSAPDMIMWSIMNRSEDLVKGFCLLIENENFMCAAALIRLQLDNLFHFYAFGLVDDMAEFSIAIMEGKEIRNMKDRSGKKMTDTYLVKQISKFDESFQQMYRLASGYIHLSHHHLYDAATIQSDGTFTMLLGGGAKFDPSGQEYHEAIGAFVWITRNLLALAKSWNEYKEKREAGDEKMGVERPIPPFGETSQMEDE